MRRCNGLTRKWLLEVILVVGALAANRANAINVSEVAEFPVSVHNVSEFATSIAYAGGAVYTVNVEPAQGMDTGLNLRTVIRKGTPRRGGGWLWESKTIEEETIEDDYHTQASIALDRNGYVHVAYNMHNMPWQYSVSLAPYDISSFEFRGQALSLTDRYTVKHQNRTPFPDLGQAAIPGNQVTYPAFFVDQVGDLYVTYRYATRPKRPFGERGFALGIAKYDVDARIWTGIGGDLTVTRADADIPGAFATVKAFAYTPGWTPYLVRITFDATNRMHASWLWRQGAAGRETSHPMYAVSMDGGLSFSNAFGKKLSLPISVKADCVINEAMRGTRMAARSDIEIDADGHPMIVVHEFGKSRALIRVDAVHRQWAEPVAMPFGAPELFVDADGGQWAVATGPSIFRRGRANKEWTKIFESRNPVKFGYPVIAPVPGEDRFFLYTQNVEVGRVKLFEVSY